MEGLLDSKKEGLIPNLPDHVSMLCLARISHGFEGVMQCVSRQWRDALRSEDIGRIRARERLSGDWLFVHTSGQSAVSWQAYDPAADCWHPLPPPPGFSTLYRRIAFCCVILNQCLLVLVICHGSYSDAFLEPSSANEKAICRMLCFDPFFRKWSELPSMKKPCIPFACAVIDGRVLIAGGGTTSVEYFDPEKNAWEALPDMPELLYDSEAITLNKLFQVLGFTANGTHRHYIFNGDEWNLAPETQELRRLLWMKKTENDEQLYGILKDGLTVLDGNTTEWRILSEPPYLGVSDLERWFPVSHGFMALNGRFYLVGGIKTYFKAVDVDAADLSVVRYCDASAGSPLYWHDARPLLGRGGRVAACAALQQE